MENNSKTERLLKADSDHILHPYFTVGKHMNRVIESAHGIMVVDTDGKEYIDTSSQLMCVNLGHGNKKIQEAVKQAISKTDYITQYWGLCSETTAELANKLAEITPETLSHFFFTSGGTESVESAAKMARAYWYNRGQGSKNKLISLYNSYHGLCGITLYLTRFYNGLPQLGYGPEPGGFRAIPPFYCYRCTYGLEYPGCNMMCARYLEQLILAEGENSIAAFIAEPIQGSGGIIAPPPEYWPMVRKICTEHNVLLIADEVMTGFARTGKMFAVENFDLMPDIITMAKGITSSYLPLGAVAISDTVYAGLEGKTYTHGFTYSGHPICCAAAVATLDVYKEENVVQNAATVGQHIWNRLNNEFLPLPCVGTLGGGKGMFHAIELVGDKKSKKPLSMSAKDELSKKLWDDGLSNRISGALNNRVIISPPCMMTNGEADKMLDIMKSRIAELKPEK